jgi:hypothetical protein
MGGHPGGHSGAAPAEARELRGQIVRVAKDSSGGTLPAVLVTVTGPAIIRPQTATTDTDGSYRFPALHGVEIYKGRPILYGLGNFIFNQTGGFERYGPLAYYSVVVEAEFAGDTLTAVRFKPLALSMDGAPEKPRGVPYLAQGGEADFVLGRLADISRRRHGTEIRVQGTSAEVVLQ